jgi:GTP-binding protein
MKKIAIIGQPNVGKSSLFNRLLRQNVAITSDISGTTRDFKKAIASFLDEDNKEYKNSYELIDTAGLDKNNIFSKEIKQISVDVANKADIILYMVDGKKISDDEDRKLFYTLAKLNKPLALIINKIDNDREKERIYEFDNFGIDKSFVISIAHNRGISALQNWIDSFMDNKEIIDKKYISHNKYKDKKYKQQKNFDDEFEEQDIDLSKINIGIVGRVNVGKSSILNAIVGYNRSIVSDIAGTTLDPVDEMINIDDKVLTFIDTAGIRRKGKIQGLEKYALMRTRKLLNKSHIAILVLDASEPMNRLDEKICGVIDEFNLGIIVVFNKWDKTIYEFDKLKKEFKHRFKFLEYAPILTISAITSRNIDKLKERILLIYEKYSYRIPTSKLNNIINDAMIKHPIPRKNNKSVKILYATQYKIQPPRISLSVNRIDGVHFSYKRYLVNKIRDNIDFEGVPVVIEVKKRISNTKNLQEEKEDDIDLELY